MNKALSTDYIAAMCTHVHQYLGYGANSSLFLRLGRRPPLRYPTLRLVHFGCIQGVSGKIERIFGVNCARNRGRGQG